MMIRAHVRGVGEVDIGFFPMRQSLDPREFLLEPLLHQRLVPFQRTMQRLLASDAELGQKPSDRDQAQRDIEFILDQRRHHLTRPQRKCELELQRILLRHRVVNPLQLLAIEFRRTSEQRLGLQRSPATTSILCQPAIDRRTIDTQNTSNNFRAFAVLNTAHRTLTHCLQRGMIQPSSIVCPHAQRESYSHRHVKNSLFTCVLINTSGARRQGQLRTRHAFLALRTFLGAFFVACFAFCAMLNSSSVLPALIAASSQRGVSPRPAQVSLRFSGLRYFGATGPRTPSPSPLERNWEVESRESFVSSASRVRRSSATLLCRAVSTWSLSFVSLSMDIDFKFILDAPDRSAPAKNGCIYETFMKRE